ncbi:MAG: YqaA family protein [Desulfobacterales bacterium]
MRKLYDWIVRWAETPYGLWALFILAVCESSFFPIPPDVLLIALAVAAPKQSLRYALVCSMGSIIGGCLGYLIGLQFMAGLGGKIIELYGLTSKFNHIQDLYVAYDAWAVGIAGFTPLPYKLFTITAGAFHIHFGIFLLASTLSRSARFFLVGALIYRFGPIVQIFIDRYFNLITIVFTVLLVGGFVVFKYIF